GVYSEPAAQVFVYPSGEAVHFVSCCFLCRVEGGSLQPALDEVSEAAFFEPSAPPPAAMAIHLQWVADALAGGPEAVVR
ncbi:MAG TPA: DNA mismatch repair protein MutT, partial [Thermaerobacter sp.]